MPEKNIHSFEEKLRYFEKSDQERIVSALELAQDHSMEAALILIDLGLDADTITAALIHGLPESSSGQFGPAASSLVKGLQTIDNIKTANRTIQEAQNIRNMFFALINDIRVIIIKLVEKLHALRVLDTSPDEKRRATARECLDIYAPLADRLGISWIKNEMEDFSLKFLNRETYQQIKEIVAEKRDKRDRFLELARETIREEAEIAGFAVEVESRAKHFYSVYMKMRKRGISADKIYDLSGMRVICDSIENCYTLLGIIHRLWKPLSGCFKDYIANPKPNGYRSLHTTVMFNYEAEEESESGEEGRWLEIQIRTREMHRIAENGIASHWLYKKGSSRDMVLSGDIDIVNKLKDWKRGTSSEPGFSPLWLEDIKNEIFKNRVYVFTPQGKVIKLPAGATPIDFAYHIHTAVGEHCIGAKANGSIIPLNSPLKNTQVVEILTSPQAHPSQNWLEIAKSSKTRSKIRSWLEKNRESHSSEKITETKKKQAAEVLPVSVTPEKKGTVQKVIQPMAPVLKVSIDGEKNMMIRFAHCCNPVTGDLITGYVSRGRGIIIHRRNCASLTNNPEFEKRIIDAEWDNAESALVRRFRIEAKFSANLFSEIESAIRKKQGHLIEGRLDETAADRLTGIFTMQLVNPGDLKHVMKNIRSIPCILEIQALS